MALEPTTYLTAAKSDLDSARQLKFTAIGGLCCLVVFITASCVYITGLVFERSDYFYVAPLIGLTSLICGFLCITNRFRMNRLLVLGIAILSGLLLFCKNLGINDLCLVCVLGATLFIFGTLIGFLVNEPSIRELHCGE